jgi:hypothetical protein
MWRCWRTDSTGVGGGYVAAAGIGLLAYLIVYGPSHLIGAGAYWEMPSKDERMYLIGYRYFLQEPWHWPVFTSNGVDAPYAKSVAFLDCIPLWALVNKLVASAVPPWRSFSAQAYLGLWHGLTYALQPCLAVACMRALGHRSWRAAVATALFFLAIPAWIFRYGHAGLSAHWIELWALYLYLRTPSRAPGERKLGIAKLGQLAVASLVAPYHAVMSLGVFTASLLRTRHTRTIWTWWPLGASTIVVTSWFAGYFAPEAHTRQWGFEVESANLLCWLVPVRSGLFGDARWIANTLATDWQWEGYAYLGLGCLGLLALVATQVRMLRGVIERHVFLFAVAVVFGLFALSNHIYWGSHEVVSYDIPRILHRIPDQLRSPGRFVWIAMYVVALFVWHQALVRSSSRRGFAIVIAAVVLQLFDARGEWAQQASWARRPWSELVDRDVWRQLIAEHDRVIIEPSANCLRYDGPSDLDLVSTEIQLLVSERALPINGTYNTRPTRDCKLEQQAWPTLTLAPGVLYVFLSPATEIADRFAASEGRCASFDHGRICSANAAAIDEVIRAGRMTAVPSR